MNKTELKARAFDLVVLIEKAKLELHNIQLELLKPEVAEDKTEPKE